MTTRTFAVLTAPAKISRSKRQPASILAKIKQMPAVFSKGNEILGSTYIAMKSSAISIQELLERFESEDAKKEEYAALVFYRSMKILPHKLTDPDEQAERRLLISVFYGRHLILGKLKSKFRKVQLQYSLLFADALCRNPAGDLNLNAGHIFDLLADNQYKMQIKSEELANLIAAYQRNEGKWSTGFNTYYVKFLMGIMFETAPLEAKSADTTVMDYPLYDLCTSEIERINQYHRQRIDHTGYTKLLDDSINLLPVKVRKSKISGSLMRMSEY